MMFHDSTKIFLVSKHQNKAEFNSSISVLFISPVPNALDVRLNKQILLLAGELMKCGISEKGQRE